MKVLEIKQDDFVNFRDPLGYPSLFIGMGSCDWKCCVEAGIDTSVCQNYELAHSAPTNIDASALLQGHMRTARSVVVGGLEPLNDMDGLLELAEAFSEFAKVRASAMRAVSPVSGNTGFPLVFVLYTGFNADEVPHEISEIGEALGPDVAFIVKYGRFVPGEEKKFDSVLGVELASPNQYATLICHGEPSLYDQMPSSTTAFGLSMDYNVPHPTAGGMAEQTTCEAVDHPQHYKSGGIEAIDVIRAFDLNFSLGNAVKYILRAGRKDKSREIEDLRKAAWYLNEEIKWRTPAECAKLETSASEVPSTGS